MACATPARCIVRSCPSLVALELVMGQNLLPEGTGLVWQLGWHRLPSLGSCLCPCTDWLQSRMSSCIEPMPVDSQVGMHTTTPGRHTDRFHSLLTVHFPFSSILTQHPVPLPSSASLLSSLPRPSVAHRCSLESQHFARVSQVPQTPFLFQPSESCCSLCHTYPTTLHELPPLFGVQTRPFLLILLFVKICNIICSAVCGCVHQCRHALLCAYARL